MARIRQKPEKLDQFRSYIMVYPVYTVCTVCTVWIPRRRMWFDCGASSHHRLDIEANHEFCHRAKEAEQRATTFTISDRRRPGRPAGSSASRASGAPRPRTGDSDGRRPGRACGDPGNWRESESIRQGQRAGSAKPIRAWASGRLSRSDACLA